MASFMRSRSEPVTCSTCAHAVHDGGCSAGGDCSGGPHAPSQTRPCQCAPARRRLPAGPAPPQTHRPPRAPRTARRRAAPTRPCAQQALVTQSGAWARRCGRQRTWSKIWRSWAVLSLGNVLSAPHASSSAPRAGAVRARVHARAADGSGPAGGGAAGVANVCGGGTSGCHAAVYCLPLAACRERRRRPESVPDTSASAPGAASPRRSEPRQRLAQYARAPLAPAGLPAAARPPLLTAGCNARAGGGGAGTPRCCSGCSKRSARMRCWRSKAMRRERMCAMSAREISPSPSTSYN